MRFMIKHTSGRSIKKKNSFVTTCQCYTFIKLTYTLWYFQRTCKNSIAKTKHSLQTYKECISIQSFQSSNTTPPNSLLLQRNSDASCAKSGKRTLTNFLHQIPQPSPFILQMVVAVNLCWFAQIHCSCKEIQHGCKLCNKRKENTHKFPSSNPQSFIDQIGVVCQLLLRSCADSHKFTAAVQRTPK